MALHRLLADAQLFGNLLVSQPPAAAIRNLELPLRELRLRLSSRGSGQRLETREVRRLFAQSSPCATV